MKKETIDRLWYIGWEGWGRRNSFGSLSRCRGRQCSVALVATTARLVSRVKWTIVEKLLPLWSYDRFNFAVVTRSLTFWVNTRIPFVVISVIIYLLIASFDSAQKWDRFLNNYHRAGDFFNDRRGGGNEALIYIILLIIITYPMKRLTHFPTLFSDDIFYFYLPSISFERIYLASLLFIFCSTFVDFWLFDYRKIIVSESILNFSNFLANFSNRSNFGEEKLSLVRCNKLKKQRGGRNTGKKGRRR